MMQRSKPPVLPAMLLILAGAQQLSAYTDPGSGALLLQILGGAAVGCMFYLRKLLGRLTRKSRTTDK